MPARSIASLAILLTSLALVGCGDTPEAAIDDYVTNLEALNAQLADIETREQAEAAKPRLRQIAERLRDADQRMEQMDVMSPEQNDALREQYLDRLRQTMLDIIGHMRRLEQADAFEPIESVFSDFN